MRDIELIQKELSELTGRKARLGSPEEPEDERLRDLERRIAEAEARLAELKSEIAELEAKVGWTAEEEAERARLQHLIDEEEAKIKEIEAKIPPVERRIEEEKAAITVSEKKISDRQAAIERLRSYIGTWNTRIEVARTLGYKMEQQTREYSLTRNHLLWKSEYETCKGWWDAVAEKFGYHSTCNNTMWALSIRLEGKWYSGYYCRPVSPGQIPNAHVIDVMVSYANGKIYELESELAGNERDLASLENELREHTRSLESLRAELRGLQDDLERAKRRLWDAKAAKERYELTITRAIALRQAEVEAAKARYELELRTLDNLKATYDTLLKEIELAKAQAIAEAARQREEVIKAKEKDRLSIAEEQRRIAEEYERLAAESIGVEREEYLDKMRRALDIAKDAEEAAIAAALEREALAVDIATRKAELARTELELEELRKELAITGERKEEAEKKVAGLPAIPKWGWIALGVGGAVATAGGIAYAVKKKKKK